MPTGKVASLPTQPGAPGQVMGGATGDNGPGMADPISAKIMDSPVITCSTVITGAIDGTETQQTGRLFRDDPGTTCEVPTTCEPFDTVPRYYDSYTFVNETGVTACVAIYLENRCGGAQSMQSAAYLGSFNPGNLCANYLG